MTTFNLLQGDALVKLKELEDNSIDSIVTDPPYGLSKQPDMLEVLQHWLAGDDYKHNGKGFMGKEWDSFVPGPAIWKECLRVLKPGGHMVAFFGTRTYDLGVVAIRIAGFEIRDQIAWVYGSGFPKSLNVSKALDKSAGAEREVVGTRKHPTLKDSSKIEESANAAHGNNTWAREWELTAAATDVAKQWDGWGTALKPAFEPIVLARKPLEGTVADNVLEHGVGAINIDGCRVEFQNDTDKSAAKPQGKATYASGKLAGKAQSHFKIVKETDEEKLYWSNDDGWVDANSATVFSDTDIDMPIGYTGVEYIEAERKESTIEQSELGRFPANLIHDGSDEVVSLFPDSKGQLAPVKGTEKSHTGETGIYGTYGRTSFDKREEGETSSARFFYCAKASAADRDEGLDAFELKKAAGLPMRSAGVESTGEGLDGTKTFRDTKRKNIHPTTKPSTLMRYLCKLITPPGGTLLDPFMGSGSTGKAAMYEGFNFVGVEMMPEYMEIAEARIAFAKKDAYEISIGMKKPKVKKTELSQESDVDITKFFG
jgi:DNA modification methylase